MPIAGFSRPGDGVGNRKSINSIQKVSVAYLNTKLVNVTIGSIDPNKTIVILDYGNPLPTNIAYNITPEIINNTTIQLTSTSASINNINVGLTIIEFNNVKSKQSGTYTSTSSATVTGINYNITIASINPSKAIALAYYADSSSGGSVQPTITSFPNATTLNILAWDGTGYTGWLKWQVLEFL
jgi:hypothetical protein